MVVAENPRRVRGGARKGQARAWLCSDLLCCCEAEARPRLLCLRKPARTLLLSVAALRALRACPRVAGHAAGCTGHDVGGHGARDACGACCCRCRGFLFCYRARAAAPSSQARAAAAAATRGAAPRLSSSCAEETPSIARLRPWSGGGGRRRWRGGCVLRCVSCARASLPERPTV